MRQRPQFYRPAPGEAQRALGLGDLSEPIIAGHEPCGVVAEVGPGVSEAEARVGQRVMDHHYCGCGVCPHCRVGWSQLCGNGFVVYGVTANGAHADYMKVPARTLVPLPDELSFATGAAISCGTGTAYNALRRMDLSRPPHARGVRPGPGRPQCRAARDRDGGAGDRARPDARAPRLRDATSAPTS